MSTRPLDMSDQNAMTARAYVTARYATAFASWHGDGKKIYHMIERGHGGEMTYVALSATCASDDAAWASAAERLRERE